MYTVTGDESDATIDMYRLLYGETFKKRVQRSKLNRNLPRDKPSILSDILLMSEVVACHRQSFKKHGCVILELDESSSLPQEVVDKYTAMKPQLLSDKARTTGVHLLPIAPCRKKKTTWAMVKQTGAPNLGKRSQEQMDTDTESE